MDRAEELKMALRHVREGEAHVARQKQIIAELRRDRHPTLEAEKLLETFEQTLKAHQDGLAVVRAEQEGSS